MWAFKTPVGKGPALRGREGPPLLLGVRDPAVELRDPARTTPTGPGSGPGRDRRLRRSTPLDERRRRRRGRRAASAPRMDDDTVDAALQPGPGRRPRHRATTSTSSWAQPTAIAAERVARLPRALRRGRAPRHGHRAPQLVGRTLPAAVRLLRRPARAPSGCSPGTSSPPTKAPASSTWPPASARRTTTPARRPASPWCARSTTGAASPPRSPTYAGLHVFEANGRHHRRPAGRRAPWSRPSPTTTATPTAGAPTPRSSTRR